MTVQHTQRATVTRPRFPNRIREYRLQMGISQRELGLQIGYCRSVIADWERGSVLPSLANAFRLAKALGTFAEHLYQEVFEQARLPQRP
jgi:putative molybdopterin biosynthesis protein